MYGRTSVIATEQSSVLNKWSAASSNLNLALKGERFLQIAIKLRKQEYLKWLVEIPVTHLLQNVGFQVECGGGNLVGDERNKYLQ